MNKHQDIDDSDEDVVVIEQRDKRTYLYVAIAGVLGLALGGLIGASVTAKDWEATYQQLEAKYQTLEQDKQQLTAQVDTKIARVDAELETKLQQAINEQKQQYQQKIKALEAQLAEEKTKNSTLNQDLEKQNQELQTATKQNDRLNQQTDMQATMFERARELFKKEEQTKAELKALEQEKLDLQPKIKALKSECDAYLDGASWDAKSDSCDKQDQAVSRLSQVEQMIRVHEMDLKQIQALSDELGL